MPKSAKTETASGDFQQKKMILAVPIDIHDWIKTIAEKTGITQPHVVKLVLEQAIKSTAAGYIEQIERTQAEKELAELEQLERDIKQKRLVLAEKLK